VRPNFVIFYPPVLYKLLGVFEVQKPMCVETFIPKLAVEIFNKNIIHRFPGFNVFNMNLVLNLQKKSVFAFKNLVSF